MLLETTRPASRTFLLLQSVGGLWHLSLLAVYHDKRGFSWAIGRVRFAIPLWLTRREPIIAAA
jgi:hypothetical protein